MSFEHGFRASSAQPSRIPGKASTTFAHATSTISTLYSENFSPLFPSDEFLKANAEFNASPTTNRKRYHAKSKSELSDVDELEEYKQTRLMFQGAQKIQPEDADEEDFEFGGAVACLGIASAGDNAQHHNDASALVGQTSTASHPEEASATPYVQGSLASRVQTPATLTNIRNAPTVFSHVFTLSLAKGVQRMHGDPAPLTSQGLRAFPPEIRRMIFRRVIDRRETTVMMLPIFKALLGDKDLLQEALSVHRRKRIYVLKWANAWKLDRYNDQVLIGVENLSISFYCSSGYTMYWDLADHLNEGRLHQLVSLQISIRNFVRGAPGHLSSMLDLFLTKCKNLHYIFVRSCAKLPDGDRYLDEIRLKLGRGAWLTRVVAGREHLFPLLDDHDQQLYEIDGSPATVELPGHEGFELKWCWFSEEGWGTEWNKYLEEKEKQHLKRSTTKDMLDDIDDDSSAEDTDEEEGETVHQSIEDSNGLTEDDFEETEEE